MSQEASTDESRREAAAQAVRDLMTDRELSISEIVKRSGLSENTVRDMVYGKKPHNTSSWNLMSGALGCMPDFLVKVLAGKADASDAAEYPMERRLAEIVGELAEISALRKDVAVLMEAIYSIDKKIDVIIEDRRSSADSPQARRTGYC